MSRGRTYRIWYDEQGNKRESRGRPSKEEMAAKERERLGIKPNPVKEQPKEPPKKEPLKEMSPDDIKEFLSLTENAINNLTKAADLSNNVTESEFLKNIAIIIKEQMRPKYLKPVNYF